MSKRVTCKTSRIAYSGYSPDYIKHTEVIYFTYNKTNDTKKIRWTYDGDDQTPTLL